jgi:hypothetical protein
LPLLKGDVVRYPPPGAASGPPGRGAESAAAPICARDPAAIRKVRTSRDAAYLKQVLERLVAGIKAAAPAGIRHQ